MQLPTTKLVHARKYAEVQRLIRSFIASNKLRDGERLPTEEQIATALGVSRTAVREGLRSLEALGLIEARQGDGRYVRALNFDTIFDELVSSLAYDVPPVIDALDVRRVLEMGFIEQAMGLLTPEDLQALRDTVAEMRRHVEHDDPFFIDEDILFHRILFGRLGNATLLKMLTYFWALFRSLLDRDAIRHKDPMAVVRMHESILHAVEVKDPHAARTMLAAHFADVEARLRAAAMLDRPLSDEPTRAATAAPDVQA